MAEEPTPLELKDISEYTGIEAESIEDFKTKFSEVYTRKANIYEDSDIKRGFEGRIFGAISTTLKNTFKEHGVEMDKKDIEGKTPEEIVSQGVTAILGTKDTEIESWKTKASKNSDEALEEMNSKYSKLESKYNDTNSLLETTRTEFENYKNDAATKIKDTKLDFYKNQWKNNGDYAPGLDPLKKKGFLQTMEEKYTIDFDEQGTPTIFQDGARIPNPKVNGTFKTPEMVLEEEGVKADVWNINPQGGKKMGDTQEKQTVTTSPKTQNRPIHPNAVNNKA